MMIFTYIYIATWQTNFQFMLFAVDNDWSDLLIEEDEDGAKKSRNYSNWNQPVVRHVQRIDHPASTSHITLTSTSHITQLLHHTSHWPLRHTSHWPLHHTSHWPLHHTSPSLYVTHHPASTSHITQPLRHTSHWPLRHRRTVNNGCFTKLPQRIFNCDKTQHQSRTLDKVPNSLIDI